MSGRPKGDGAPTLSASGEVQAGIDDWRRRIDTVDQQLMRLLNSRSACAVEIGRRGCARWSRSRLPTCWPGAPSRPKTRGSTWGTWRWANRKSSSWRSVHAAGAKGLRGGAFKPRTSPYAFQGHGEDALRWMRAAADQHDQFVVSEVMDPRALEMMMGYVDCLQVGARNMQNFDLLKELGRVRKPVLLKRGLSATIEEWLLSAEYVLSGGNDQVVLCERGIRTFENATRNTLDLSAIPVVKKRSHLPIVVDPSHGTGRRDKVIPMARAAVAAGADGLLIEVHNDPDHALSDGAQSLYPDQFGRLMGELRIIAAVLGRSLPLAPVPTG